MVRATVADLSGRTTCHWTLASVGLPLDCGEYRVAIILWRVSGFGSVFFSVATVPHLGSAFSLGGDGHTCSTPREGALCFRWRGYHDRYLKWRSHCTLFKVAMLPRSLFKVEEPLGEVGVDALPQLTPSLPGVYVEEGARARYARTGLCLWRGGWTLVHTSCLS